MKIRFNLDNRRQGTALIMMIIKTDFGLCKYSTGERIPIRYWNLEKRHLNFRSEYPEARRVNTKLDRFKREVISIQEEYYRSGRALGCKDLKSLLDSKLKGKKTQTSQIDSLQEYMKRFIDVSVARVSNGTLKVYNTALAKLNDCFKTPVAFEDLTIDHYRTLAEYLWSQNYNDAYVHKIVSTIRTVVNAAVRDSQCTGVDNPFDNKLIGLKKRSSEKLYLNTVTLEQLLKIELDEGSPLAKTRDIFYVQCQTGLRYSDIAVLNKQHIITLTDGKMAVRLTTNKTGKTVVVPLSPSVLEILEKYNYQLPVCRNAPYNRSLKLLGEILFGDETIEVHEFRKGKKLTTKRKKAEELTTHTARRSFVTNCLIAGIPSNKVQSMTGHTSMKTFEAYDRYKPTEVAEDLKNLPFFS